MGNYWLTQYVLATVGWGYALVSVTSIVIALWLPKSKKNKFLATVIVIGLASVLPFRGYEEHLKAQEAAQNFQVRLAKARALFEERCKSAGERIYKIVDDVDGILLVNVRADDKIENEANPFWPDAGLPNEGGGNGYVMNFLMWESTSRDPRGALNEKPRSSNDYPGYRYVDVKNSDGSFWRYAIKKEVEQDLPEPGFPNLVKKKSKTSSARYAVVYQNIVNEEDRKNWVAGSIVIVSDSHTGEILAQGTWYSFEPGLGSRTGGRQPWRFAQSCPELLRGQERAPARFFVDQVLKPKKDF